MSKHSGVPLIPDGPGDEHGEGGHRTRTLASRVSSLVPPVHDRVMEVPLVGIDVGKSQLVDDGSPQPKSVQALKEQMWPRFLLSFAELA